MTRSLARLLTVLTLVAVALSGCMNPFAPVSYSQLPAEAKEFVTLMNDHRVSQGLVPLQWHPEIAGVALAHSRDMRNRDYFSHNNPDGKDPFERMEAAGISFQRAGENIAMGYATGQAVFTGWYNSSGHRDNMEEPGYTHHGLGYVEDGNYWTHVFAKNPTVE